MYIKDLKKHNSWLHMHSNYIFCSNTNNLWKTSSQTASQYMAYLVQQQNLVSYSIQQRMFKNSMSKLTRQSFNKDLLHEFNFQSVTVIFF